MPSWSIRTANKGRLMDELWTLLTGDPEQEIPRCCWMGGYDADGEWQQTVVSKEIYPEDWFSLLTGEAISHPVTHWAPFLAPGPPAAPETFLDIVFHVARFLADTSRYTKEEARWLSNELFLAAEKEKETHVRSS